MMSNNYIHNAEEITDSLDWSIRENVQIDLNEHAFMPQVVEFKRGVPYRLRLTNQGKLKHNFSAEEFFRAIAIRRLASKNDGDVRAPFLYSIGLEAGGTFDLFFVPVETGNYDLTCTVSKHSGKRMVGQLQIK